MTWYKKRTILGNRYCCNKLCDFRSDVIEYFNNVTYDRFNRYLAENEAASRMRPRINESLHEAHEIVVSTGVNPVLTYSPPPAIGGYRQNIDIFHNIFNMYRYEIEPNDLLDFIDRAIGRYESDRLNSIARTFNPFFWFGRFLDLIVSIPFRFLKKAGVSTKLIEDSVVGKLAKFILYIVTLVASILTILQLLGYLDSFNLFIKKYF